MVRAASFILAVTFAIGTLHSSPPTAPAQRDWGPDIADLLHLGRHGACGCPRL